MQPTQTVGVMPLKRGRRVMPVKRANASDAGPATDAGEAGCRSGYTCCGTLQRNGPASACCEVYTDAPEKGGTRVAVLRRNPQNALWGLADER